MSNKRYNYKDIPPECLIDIYRGLSKELLKQPTGKKNFKKALVSWKNTGALRRLHKKYSTFTTGKKTQVEWDGKSQHMIPYNRIQEIYNQIRKEYEPKGGEPMGGQPKIHLWNKEDRIYMEYERLIVKAIKEGKRQSWGKSFYIKIE